MLLLLVAAVLAQSPAPGRGPVAVLVSSKRAGAEAISPKLAARVFATLTREGLPDLQDDEKTAQQIKAAGFSDARNCQGGSSCLTKLAVLLGAHAVVVGVDVGKIGKQLAVHLEALSSAGESLALSDFTASIDNFGDDSAVPITVFARALASKMGTAPPATATPSDLKKPVDPLADAPMLAHVEPAPLPPLELVAPPMPPPERSSRIPGIAFGGAAVASLGVSGVFAFLGTQDQNAYTASKFTSGGAVASHLPQSELDRLASEGNTRFTIALTTALVGVGLAAASTFFLIRD